MVNSGAAPALRQRLLQDIAELQENPYPNIRLHVRDDDITKACLILTPQYWKGLHLTVHFGSDYPLKAPQVTIQSTISHPNVFGDYICASILNTEEGYTPAYTLKGIAIQLLSFFSSDKLEQSWGGSYDLTKYRTAAQVRSLMQPRYRCEKCQFGCGSRKQKPARDTDVSKDSSAAPPAADAVAPASTTAPRSSAILRLPDEVVLLILQQLEFEELTSLAQAWPRISMMITDYDLIRTRELQCYVLKKDYREVELGIGVRVSKTGRQGTIQSEFDLVSRRAVRDLGIRSSVHGIPFHRWLPLPISHAHWRRVRDLVAPNLSSIASDAWYSDAGLVLYGFMNDIVVRLNMDLESQGLWDAYQSKSTLRHASEKAIESYFHLFHLLLCLATRPAGQSMVPAANKMIQDFMAGKRSKKHVPNLGYLLIALLISDVEVTEHLRKAIITEAITRNVVWLLDQKGAGMAELAYLELDETSDYRLKKTFEGSRTSYRLLMFSELFRRTARPSARPSKEELVDMPSPSPSPTPSCSTPTRTYSSAVSLAPVVEGPPSGSSSGGKTSLVQLRDELFARHGAPPPGTAAHLASEVRRLQKINDFPSFLREMGIANIPSKRNFTEVLRSTVMDSIKQGYSKAAISQQAALALRRRLDGTLDQALMWKQMEAWGSGELPDADTVKGRLERRIVSFFPGKDKPLRRERSPSW